MSFFIYVDKFDPRHVHFSPAQCEHPHSPNNGNTGNTGNNGNTGNTGNTGKFSRITYSTNHISLNNVGFVLSDAPVASLVRVENAILDKYVLQLGEPRRPVHSIASQTSDDTLAIYGVWETRDECGLVYK